MKQKIKLWCEKHKQEVVIWTILTIMGILTIGVLFRGLYSLGAIGEEETKTIDGISFNITSQTDSLAATTALQNSSGKLYKDRDIEQQELMTAPPPAYNKNVSISFAEVLQKGNNAPTQTNTPPPQPSIMGGAQQEVVAASTYHATNPSHKLRSEQEQVKAELAKIYGNTPSDKNVINNTNNESADPPLPPVPTEEELLAQKKKRMEGGFDLKSSSAIAATTHSNISIIDPLEITAFIHGAQTVKAGRRVALRLDNKITLSNGQQIPRNTIIYGDLSIERSRAMITIPTIKYLSISTPSLICYSEDGMPGFPIEIEENQRIIGDATGKAAATALDRTISTATGGLVGSIARDLTGVDRTKRETYVTLSDNRKVYLKVFIKK